MFLATVYNNPILVFVLSIAVIIGIVLFIFLVKRSRLRREAKYIKKVNDRIEYLEQKEQEKQLLKQQRKNAQNNSKQ